MHNKYVKRGVHHRSHWDIPPHIQDDEDNIRDAILGEPGQPQNNAGSDPFANGPVTLTFTVVDGPENTPVATLSGDEPTVTAPAPSVQTTTNPVSPVQTPGVSSISGSVSYVTTMTTMTSSIPTSTSVSSSSSSTTSTGVPSPSISDTPGNGTSTAADNGSTATVRLSSGAIAGIVIGCLIVLIAATIFGFRKRSLKNRLKLRGVWTSSKSLRLGGGGNGTGGLPEFEPTPYTYQPPEGGVSPAVQGAGNRRMSYVGAQPATFAAVGNVGVQSPVSARSMSTLGLELPQALPSAYGFEAGYGIGSAGAMPSPSRNAAAAARIGSSEFAVVARTFIPSLPDELTISSGESLQLLEVFDDGWAECMNRIGEVGMVPLECFDRPSSAQASGLGVQMTSTSPVGGEMNMTREEGSRNSRRYTSLPGARR
ncbi:hypothetical protein NP233_g117 [Leucocoprinus birnbaumii]|uniref:SH3 domain-containing protein n=1 Tax=Leucocoprinus birnbaumii TaxID=56174 RepID=A0AAD5W2R9_9AGAR|nr:hypothetical protein NP233_g117 [Leucocoprinus birnbaumii]